ncbi:hypothetical protein BDY21DRAFT_110024 [Lineolata rhizophorae]|uniref:Uncharacterized protein n=1 Tax=Lineolata rhizophorae TaxID=578093 RepID=A0A6A6NSX4_9PEZI|nr:hypothetical protein BDY21DRAFT_110024 [Lineolata rhizophorae]
MPHHRSGHPWRPRRRHQHSSQVLPRRGAEALVQVQEPQVSASPGHARVIPEGDLESGVGHAQLGCAGTEHGGAAHHSRKRAHEAFPLVRLGEAHDAGRVQEAVRSVQVPVRIYYLAHFKAPLLAFATKKKKKKEKEKKAPRE